MLKARVAFDPTSEDSSANSARLSVVADSVSLRLGRSCTPSHVSVSPARDARWGCMHEATNAE